ncbi:MAG: ABC transporter ATP-binding protein, partial [Clostridia bacterium]|nr:ABC transporter ATP-binding protein [Clostridia bacterium]
MEHFKIENLTFSYPGTEKKALNDISLKIERGQYVTLCGKSGSGKTTLLRHFKTVLTPHGERNGNVYFEGKPLSEVSMRDQSAKIAYVMQNPDSQIVTDKVWHELAFGLESLGCDQRTMRLRVAEMASYFGIQNWFHRNVA